ncbi:MAG TPA: hypothetical protein DDZ84_09445 [Firmicutes bacterium]|nr:hypothetical protein [Bacillota bacterium]
MRLRMKRAIPTLIGLAVILAAASGRADAQVSLSFTPMLVELTATPGSVRTFEVIMMNQSKATTAEFLIYAADLAQKPNGDYEVVDVGKAERSCARWIKLSADRATVGPSGAFAVKGTLTVPRGASGGRYAAVVFELIPEPRKGEPAFASSTFVQRFVTVVELAVPARQVRKRLDVTGFNVAHASEKPAYASTYGKKAIILSAQVKNEGDIHVFACGSMILRDSTGKRLREIPLGAGRGVVLPGATVNLGSVLPGGLAPGDYVADVSVKYGGTRPARAKVPFSVGTSGTEVAEAETAAVIAPFSVDPGDLDLSYPPGATAAKSLVIENRSDQAIRVEGRALPLAFDEEGELVLGEEASSVFSCAQWIELRPAAVEIKPRSRQVVRMMISIPKGEAGGKYANVVFTATPVSEEKGQMWSGESGAVVFLRIGKEFDTVGTLTPISMDNGGPSVGMVFGTVFENTGTIHVKPRASMTIKKRVMPESVPGIEYVGPGSLVEVNAIDLGEEENVVLPGGKRVFDVAVSGNLEPGDYVVEFLVSYGGKSPLYVVREFTVE